MKFTSPSFLFLFMPVFLLVYRRSKQRYRNYILLLGSIIFYAATTAAHPAFLILLLACMLVSFEAGLMMEKYPSAKRAIFACAAAFQLSWLLYFKYVPVPEDAMRILPPGISFYTFQIIAYLADVMQGTIHAEKSLLRYSAGVAMFPHIISGPLPDWHTFTGELRRRELSHRDLTEGMMRFVSGLGMKLLLADPLGRLWSQCRAIGFESLSCPLAWMAAAAFSLQIYFDFCGYSEMACGLGRMLGFHLPQNFRTPYRSLTMTDFWRRWHITLGQWFRTYVYIPLGGSRKGTMRTVISLAAVWALTGIWHGTGLHFLIWAAVMFVLVCAEKFGYGNFLQRHPAIGHLYMWTLIPLTWVLFAADDPGQAGVLYGRMFSFFGGETGSSFQGDYLKYLHDYGLFFAAGIFFCSGIPASGMKRIRRPQIRYALLTAVFLLCLVSLYRGTNDPFMYSIF